LITKLMECQNCHLYFRYPTDKKETNANFYQIDYKEADHITTELPDHSVLEQMKMNGFRTANRNGDRFLELFARLFPSEASLKIMDYGCSWGYLTYQFKKAGHQVQGYEISRPRAEYGIKQLGLEIYTDENLLTNEYDIFFSSHVIEHHPDIAAMIELGKSLLKKGGYFVAICPNGSMPYRHKNKDAFHHCWGKVHPNYLNVDFYKYVFGDHPYHISSSPIVKENIHPLRDNEKIIDDLSGEELLIIAKF
jgi:2-polyprenyl-3-methyl-5-hydroxy-6-metoxy-1,4-benzoquinol methylase